MVKELYHTARPDDPPACTGPAERPSQARPTTRVGRLALRIALPFTALTILWIGLSDLLLSEVPDWLIENPAVHIAKGVLYALVAGTCLYLLFRRESARRAISEGRLAESETRYHSLFRDSHAAMLLFDPASGAIVDANAAAARFYGHPVERLRRMRAADPTLEPTDEKPGEKPVRPMPAQSPAQSPTRSPGGSAPESRCEPGCEPGCEPRRRAIRAPHRLADGSVRDVVAYVGPVVLDGRSLLCGIVHDITPEVRERQLAELMREVDEQLLAGAGLGEILAPLCRRIADIWRLNLAWVALKQPDGGLSVHGAGGPSAAYANRIVVRWDDTPEGQGPAGRAIRTGKPHRAALGDPEFAPWAERADRYGIRAVASLPMLFGREAVGALNVYAAREAMFDADTLAGLQALAARLSLVVFNTRTQTQMRLQVAALQAAANGVVITDAEGRIEWVNDSFAAITGYSHAALLGATPALLRSGRHDRAFYADLWSTVLAGRPWRGEIVNRCKDGTLITVAETITPIRDEDGRIAHFVAIHEDVTARRHAEERSAYLSGHDPLTALPNRALFHDRLSQAIRRADHAAEPVGLVVLDIHRFKEINDSRGHEFGDLLLREVAGRILGTLSVTDTAARIGSDEFGVIVSDLASGDRLAAVGAGLAAAVAGIERLDGQPVQVAASIGAAIYPGDARSAEALVRCADMALGLAKAAGAGEARFYSSEMGEQLAAKAALRNALAHAIDAGQFRLLYQPQVEIASTGAAGPALIVGAEALLRWESPEQGLVSPALFMAVAEESGLIARIGDWVIEEVCRQLAAWRRAGLAGPKVAINLSAVQLQAGGLPDRFAELMRRYGIAGESLEVELTETVLLIESEDVVGQLRALDAMGIELALDDFGTGYSSLSYLRRFPIRKLKIDRSFVASMTVSESDRAIVHAVISLARSLGMAVIAEGVETEAQIEALDRLGCSLMQGYVYSRPLPPERLAERLGAATRKDAAVKAAETAETAPC